MDTELTSMKLTTNSYLSLGLVVLVISATLWIKDGQTKSLRSAENTSAELSHYKEMQAKDGEILKTKLDGITDILHATTADRFSTKDAKQFAHQLQQLNPTIKVPDIP